MRRSVLYAFFLLASLSAAAEDNPLKDGSTQNLYLDCRSSSAIRSISCMQYISGVLDAMVLVGLTSDKNNKWFGACPNEEFSSGQMKQMFLNWAEKNPEEWQNPKGLSVWKFIHGRWPCK